MGCGASAGVPNEGGNAPVTPTSSSPDSNALVLLGPVIGLVTTSTALVMLEIDEVASITCTATPEGGAPISVTKTLNQDVPGVFHLNGLQPGTHYVYHVTFTGLMATASTNQISDTGCAFRTIPEQPTTLRFVALSCDRPSRLLDGEINPWDQIGAICKKGECDVVLHLGDQVYAKDNNWKKAAMRVTELLQDPEICKNKEFVAKVQSRAFKKLQEAYRATWSNSQGIAEALAHSSHLMLWSDNDVANDFTILRKPDGTQAYSPQYLRVAMTVYQYYQRQLRDPKYPVALPGAKAGTEPHVPSVSPSNVEEGLFQLYGKCGLILIDSRGHRIQPNGELVAATLDGVEEPMMSEHMRKMIDDAFATPGLSCLLVCSDIPFVGDSPEACAKKVDKFPFLKDHWPYPGGNLKELTWLLDKCFAFKKGGGEVVMVGGDIHCGVDSQINDSTTGTTIRHITTSSVTNHVCGFYPELEGQLNDRYSYVHRPLPKMEGARQRTYCKLNVNFDASTGSSTVDIDLVVVPTNAH